MKFQQELEQFFQSFSGMESDNFLEAMPDIQEAIELLSKKYETLKEKSGGVVFCQPSGILKRATFVSECEEGTVETKCWYNPETGEITDIEQSDSGIDYGLAEYEYIVYDSGDDCEIVEEELAVCPECHCHTLKSVMVEGPSHTYDEHWVCSDPECENALF